MKEFTEKLNSHSPRKIEVVEYVPENTGGKQTEILFREMVDQMIEKGETCHGLVISGHHTGAFYGNRTQGKLSVDFLEDLSCDPAYAGWFGSVNALWLQGCRSLGTTDGAVVDADNLARRIGRHREEDGIEASFAELNAEYSATLDRDNPLSSRFLRVFPNATVFGWTATAPGNAWHSEYSIPYHIAHISKVAEGSPRVTADPVADQIPEKAAAAYANWLLSTLSPPLSSGKPCESLVAKGWISHGNSAEGEPGFMNPKLSALTALLGSDDQEMIRALAISCTMKNRKSTPEEITQAVREALKSDSSIAYNFNAIWGLLQQLRKAERTHDLETLEKVLVETRGNPMLRDFIERKLQTPTLGVLRKIDYQAFYEENLVTPARPGIPNMAATLKSEALTEFFSTTDSANAADLADYKITLMKSLVKHGMLAEGEMIRLIRNSATDVHTLNAITAALSSFDPPLKEPLALLREVVKSPKANGRTFEFTARYVRDSRTPVTGTREIVRSILTSPKSTPEAVSAVFEALSAGGSPEAERAEILLELAKSPKSSPELIEQVVTVIKNAPKSALYRPIIETIAVRTANNAKSIADLTTLLVGEMCQSIPIQDRFTLISRLASHPKSDSMTGLAIVQSLANPESHACTGSGFSKDQGLTLLSTLVKGHKLDGAGLDLAMDYTNQVSGDRAPQWLLTLASDPAATTDSLDSAWRILSGYGRFELIPATREIMNAITLNPAVSYDTFKQIMDSYQRYSDGPAQRARVLDSIIRSPKTPDYILDAALQLIAAGTTEQGYAMSDARVAELLRHPNLYGDGLSNIVNILGEKRAGVRDSDALMEMVLRHPRFDSETAVALIWAKPDWYSRVREEATRSVATMTPPLIALLLADDRLDDETRFQRFQKLLLSHDLTPPELKYLANTVRVFKAGRERYADLIVEQVLKSSQADTDVFHRAFRNILNSSPTDPAKVARRFLADPRLATVDNNHLNWIAAADSLSVTQKMELLTVALEKLNPGLQDGAVYTIASLISLEQDEAAQLTLLDRLLTRIGPQAYSAMSQILQGIGRASPAFKGKVLEKLMAHSDDPSWMAAVLRTASSWQAPSLVPNLLELTASMINSPRLDLEGAQLAARILFYQVDEDPRSFDLFKSLLRTAPTASPGFADKVAEDYRETVSDRYFAAMIDEGRMPPYLQEYTIQRFYHFESDCSARSQDIGKFIDANLRARDFPLGHLHLLLVIQGRCVNEGKVTHESAIASLEAAIDSPRFRSDRNAKKLLRHHLAVHKKALRAEK